MILARFGTILKFNEEYYVYLGETTEGDVLYAARILNIQKTDLLKKAEESYAKKPNNPIHDSLTLCFIILTTDDFSGQCAHLHNSDGGANPNSNITYTDKSLNEKDTKELKNTILTDKAIPLKLKKIVEKLGMEN